VKMKLTKNTKIVLAVVGVVVYGALGYFMVVSRQGAKAADLQAQVAQVEQQIIEKRTATAQSAAVVPVRVADLFRLSKAMPDTDDMPGLIIELNKLARDSGVSFETFTPTAGPDGGGFGVKFIDVQFDGNFYDLTDFIYRTRTLVSVRDGELDARGRLFNVTSLEFSEGVEHFPDIRAKLRLEAYTYGSTAAVAPGAVPAPTAPTDGTTPAPAADGSTPAPPQPQPPAGGEGATAMGATN
jgi:Tfp pilus assembly protein PilO